MKKIAKFLTVISAIAMISSVSAIAVGCGDGVPEWLEQATCEHSWQDVQITKEATCAEEGEKKVTCELCGLEDVEAIKKLPHTEIKMTGVDATCLNSGLTEGVKCAECDEVIVSQKIVPPAGHNVVKDAAVPAKCLTSGKTEGSHCDRCGVVFVPQETVEALGHNIIEMNASEATCEKDGYTGGSRCSRCTVVYTGEIVPAIGHVWGEATITDPTCAKEGSEERTCTLCEEVKAVSIPKLDHTYEFVRNTLEPTCTTDGLALYQCTGCEDAAYAEVLPAPGHDYFNDECKVCGDNYYEVDGISMLPVSLNISASRPTLTYTMSLTPALADQIKSGVYSEFGFVAVRAEDFKDIDTGKSKDFISELTNKGVEFVKSPVTMTFDSMGLPNKTYTYSVQKIAKTDVNSEYLVFPYVVDGKSNASYYKYAAYPTNERLIKTARSAVYMAVESLNNVAVGQASYSEAQMAKLNNIVKESVALIHGVESVERGAFYLAYNDNFSNDAEVITVSEGETVTVQYTIYAIKEVNIIDMATQGFGAYAKPVENLRLPVVIFDVFRKVVFDSYQINDGNGTYVGDDSQEYPTGNYYYWVTEEASFDFTAIAKGTVSMLNIPIQATCGYIVNIDEDGEIASLCTNVQIDIN